MNPIINLKRLLEKILKKIKHIVIKCYDTPGDNDLGSYEINLLYYGQGSPEECFIWIDKLLKALDSQGISTWPIGTSRGKKEFQELQKERQRAKCSNQKKIRSLLKTRKGRRQKRSSSTFKKCGFLTMKIKRVSPNWQKA